MCQGPLEVAAVGGGWITTMLVLSHRRASLTFTPFMDFRMAIGEAKPAGAVMVAGRQVVDPIAWIVRADDDEAIVDAVRMLIHKHPQIHRRRPRDIAQLIVLEAVGRIGPCGDSRVAIPILFTAGAPLVDPDLAQIQPFYRIQNKMRQVMLAGILALEHPHADS